MRERSALKNTILGQVLSMLEIIKALQIVIDRLKEKKTTIREKGHVLRQVELEQIL